MAVRGTVVRVGNIKPLVIKLAFECNSCKQQQIKNCPDGLGPNGLRSRNLDRMFSGCFFFFFFFSAPAGKFVPPTSCTTSDCRSQTFNPLRVSPHNEVCAAACCLLSPHALRSRQTVDFQSVRVQEIVDDDQRESG